ncbi:MAG: hypothetical protein IJW81_02995 [Clostridia bacterium]|nr:hypothetical protein [Clostridia bacterium]
MTNKKRILAALLAALMLASSLASCSEKAAEETQDTTAADTEASPAGVEETAADTEAAETSDGLIGVDLSYNWKEGVDQNNYDGYTFTILNGCTATWYSYLNVIVEETTGEPVNDGIYERTQRVNEYLNVNIAEHQVSDSAAELRNSVKGGTDDFGVALCTLMGDFAIAQEGNVYDLNTLEGLHLDQVWWDQNANEDLAINNKLYFTTGSFDTTRFDSIRALYFNQQLIKDYNLTNPYEMVDNNKWTIDNFAAMLEAGVHDADGDGLWTDKDKYGWITYNEIGIDMLTRGCGVNYIDKDPETGYLIDGTDGEKLIDVYTKIYEMYWGGNDVFDIRQSRFTPYLRGNGDRIIQELFMENATIFYSECMAWTRELRNMEADFGIVPPPKYDQEQDRYYSIILNPFMQMIPVTVEDVNRNANILDALNAASHDTVMEGYVNITLQGKSSRDEDTVRMLRLVFDDLSYNLHFANITIRSTVTGGISGAKESISSDLKRSAKMLKKSFEKLNNWFFDVEE